MTPHATHAVIGISTLWKHNISLTYTLVLQTTWSNNFSSTTLKKSQLMKRTLLVAMIWLESLTAGHAALTYLETIPTHNKFIISNSLLKIVIRRLAGSWSASSHLINCNLSCGQPNDELHLEYCGSFTTRHNKIRDEFKSCLDFLHIYRNINSTQSVIASTSPQQCLSPPFQVTHQCSFSHSASHRVQVVVGSRMEPQKQTIFWFVCQLRSGLRHLIIVGSGPQLSSEIIR